jgi:hypothetical protein
MRFNKAYVAVLLFGTAAVAARADTFISRLSPDDYDVFLFNNGSGFIVVDGAVDDYLSGTLNCNTEGNEISIFADPGMSDRVIANLLSAKVAEADIFLRITDDFAQNPADACSFNGMTFIGID